jgi:hypothetical protein
MQSSLKQLIKAAEAFPVAILEFFRSLLRQDESGQRFAMDKTGFIGSVK